MRRPERAQNEGPTGPNRLDDTRSTLPPISENGPEYETSSSTLPDISSLWFRFMVQGLGFRVKGLEFRVWGLGLGFRV